MNYNYFYQNKKCEYFPCHKTKNIDDFNCMFCYCPLYMLGDKCGGNYKILNNNIKDCSECLIPHTKNAHQYIENKFNLIKKYENKIRANKEKI